MYRIGHDIVKISRIEKSLNNSLFKAKVFTNNEIKYCKNVENYAGIFAAKEAYLKAIESENIGNICKVEILHKKSGKPYINGVDNSDLSISHDGEYASATVILWE